MFIIVSLVHKRSFITGSVLRKLTNFITSNPESNQYLGRYIENNMIFTVHILHILKFLIIFVFYVLECLHKLCKNQKLHVVENNTEILKLFKEIPIGMTDKVTSAVMPVLKTSTYLRDNIIMILRKELISK